MMRTRNTVRTVYALLESIFGAKGTRVFERLLEATTQNFASSLQRVADTHSPFLFAE